MKDERKPSAAMVDKLLKAQGINLKLNKFIQNSAHIICKPYLSGFDTEEDKIKFVEDNLGENTSIDAFVKIYAKYLSASDIMDMIAFHKSSVGQKLSRVQEKIAIEIMSAAQEVVQKVVIKAMKHSLKQTLGNLDDLDNLEDPDKYEELT